MATSNEKLPIEKEAPPPFPTPQVPPPIQPQPEEPETQPIPPPAPKPRPEIGFCGYSKKCCYITVGLATVLMILFIISPILLLVYLQHLAKAPEKTYECTLKGHKRDNGGKAIQCGVIGTFCEDAGPPGTKNCITNTTLTMCEPGQICEIEVTGGSSESRATCTSKTEWVGCHYSKTILFIGSPHGQVICRCDTSNCNTWAKCGCKKDYLQHEKAYPCSGFAIKFNWIFFPILTLLSSPRVIDLTTF